ncbi:MAG: glycosyltransferase 87 family protein [Candidatus Eisenbacteria bacterium]
MIDRITGNPIFHRVLAFVFVLVGGNALGQALRSTTREPLLDFGPLYVGAWMVREGRGFADLYDPDYFAGVVSHVAPAGRILDLGATPPALVFLTYPFTWFTPEGGKFLFAAAGVAALLCGLFVLGAGRTLGWNRTEWIGFSGLVLWSGAAKEAVLRGSPAPWVFLFLCFAVSLHAVRRERLAAAAAGIAANLSPVGWGVLAYSLWIGSPRARIVAGLFASGGLLLQLLALGPEGLRLYAAAFSDAWLHAPAWDPSWTGRMAHLLGTVGIPAALVLVAMVAIAGWSRLRAVPEFWREEAPESPRRLGTDPPRLPGVVPALVTGLCCLASPEFIRGSSVVWALPVWASLTWFEHRPTRVAAISFVTLAVGCVVPEVVVRHIGTNASANLIALASLGLVIWWWWTTRGWVATDRRSH